MIYSGAKVLVHYNWIVLTLNLDTRSAMSVLSLRDSMLYVSVIAKRLCAEAELQSVHMMAFGTTSPFELYEP